MGTSLRNPLLLVILGFLLTCISAPSVAAVGDAELGGDLNCLDPHIAKEGSKYYLSCSGGGGGRIYYSPPVANPLFNEAEKREGFVPIRCSPDMKHWSLCGHVFDTTPAWIQKEIPEAAGAWASSLSYFSGKWHVYYAATSPDRNRSVIGVATNEALDPTSTGYKWEDEGLVIESFPSDDGRDCLGYRYA